jgi:hypothetical protein
MQDMINEFCTKLSISIPIEENPFDKAIKLMREVRENLKNEGLCVAHLKTPEIPISPKETINGNNSPIEMSASVPKNVVVPKRTLSWRDNLHTVHEFIIHNITPRSSNASSPNASRDSSPRVSKESSNQLSPRFMNKQSQNMNKQSQISSPLIIQLSQYVVSSKTPKPDFNL